MIYYHITVQGLDKTMRFMNWVVAAALLTGSSIAAALGPSAEPQCAQVICLSPADGTPAPGECRPIRAVYFNIRVFDPNFDPPATAKLRDQYLRMCSTARSIELNKIRAKYGMLFADPMTY